MKICTNLSRRFGEWKASGSIPKLPCPKMKDMPRKLFATPFVSLTTDTKSDCFGSRTLNSQTISLPPFNNTKDRNNDSCTILSHMIYIPPPSRKIFAVDISAELPTMKFHQLDGCYQNTESFTQTNPGNSDEFLTPELNTK